MKVPPTNNMNGYNMYEEEHYFNDPVPTIDGVATIGAPTNGNVGVEDFEPAPPEDPDFSEYMWMENEEEFDKEVMQRLEEEELMEQCMLENAYDHEHPPNGTPPNNGNLPKVEAVDMAKSSTLNPHAAEFVPSWSRANTVENKST